MVIILSREANVAFLCQCCIVKTQQLEATCSYAGKNFPLHSTAWSVQDSSGCHAISISNKVARFVSKLYFQFKIIQKLIYVIKSKQSFNKNPKKSLSTRPKGFDFKLFFWNKTG